MTVKKIIENRKSHHIFVPNHKISPESFIEIINTVRHCPSGYNAQPWHFVLVQKPKNLANIEKAAFGQKHIQQSGNAVVILGNTQFFADEKGRILEEWERVRGFSAEKIEKLKRSLEKERSISQKKMMTLRSSALVGAFFMLMSEESGWQTCPMMGFDHKRLKMAINAPEHYMPVLLFALGKADFANAEAILPRKEAKTMISFENF